MQGTAPAARTILAAFGTGSSSRAAAVIPRLRLDGHLHDLPHFPDAEHARALADVHVQHLELLLPGHSAHGAVVDVHRPTRQAVLLLQVRVHEEEPLALLRRSRGEH